MFGSVFSKSVAQRLSGLASAVALLVVSTLVIPTQADAQSSVRPPSNASSGTQPPQPEGGDTGNLSNALGNNSDADFWRALREGERGTSQVSGPGANKAMRAPEQRLTGEQAIREAAESGGAISRATSPNLTGVQFQAIRNGPLVTYGAYVMGGMLALLALFYLIRGRIRVEHGLSGFTVTRFMTIERMAHWLLAVSFIILAISGLAITYGKTFLSPLLGKELFATIAVVGKWLHNYVAFAFMVGLVMIVVMWLKHNLPSRTDINWILKGGGMFTKGSHPPAKKFNFGQKVIFWLVLLGGISISMSGIALMFPYQTAMFGKTFALLNAIGFSFPTDLTLIQEQQLASLWHAAMAIFLVAVIFAHIYIGTLGMEGAFDAMGSGEVDVNWAKEHHSIWYEEVASEQQGSRAPDRTAPAPAE